MGSVAVRKSGCLWNQSQSPSTGQGSHAGPPWCHHASVYAQEKVTFCPGQELRVVFHNFKTLEGNPRDLGHQVLTLENQMMIDVIKFYGCMATLPHLPRPWLFLQRHALRPSGLQNSIISTRKHLNICPVPPPCCLLLKQTFTHRCQ